MSALLLLVNLTILSELRVFVDDLDFTCTLRVNPSVVVPMKILFHEKYTSENIQILQKLAKVAKITGNPQVSAVTQCSTLITDCMYPII